jgi:outer membrane protein OmpA-like peptidoglycan-associated protein
VLDNFQKYESTAFKAILGIGVVVLFWYCAFFINFFPTGLTLGDSLVFLFIALGFGFFYIFWLAIGYLVCLCALYALPTKIGKTESCWFRLLIGVAGVIFIIFLSSFWYFTGNFFSFFAPIVSGLLLILATVYWTPAEESASDEVKKQRILYRSSLFSLAFLFVPILGGSALEKFVEASIRIIGVSNPHASLIVNEENFKIITNVAEEIGVPVIGCSSESDGNNIVHNFRISWHGIGERSLVELLVPSANPSGWEGIVKIELEREGLKLLDTTYKSESTRKIDLKACLSLDADALFSSNEDTPNLIGKKRLNQLKRKLDFYFAKGDLNIDAVTVTGYTDRRDVKAEGDDNYKLSKRRANSVYGYIASTIGTLPKGSVVIEGMGPLNPISNCDPELKGIKEEACLAPDRRVEIELSLTHPVKES